MDQNQAGFSAAMHRPVDRGQVRAWFEDPRAVDHYGRAALALGLWRSEQILLERLFARGDRILDVGCGAGRISFGLWRLGFGSVSGVDYSAAMIARAREIADALACPIDFHVADADRLPEADGARDGLVFGFNGLMQIPGRANRRVVLRELRRVVKPGGQLMFTTHDRGIAREQWRWQRELRRWQTGRHDPALVEFGDRVFENQEGRIFIHLPDRAEVIDDLVSTAWIHEADHLRSELANEARAVREFSDECRFWVARRPASDSGAAD